MGKPTIPSVRGTPLPSRQRLRWLTLAAAVGLAMPLSACSSAGQNGSGHGSRSGSGRVIQVVAAENFWGSIASQVGGSHAHVTSIVTDPNADPHSYEPTTADARSVASAGMVIVNGIGYDPWMPRLVAADTGSRTVLTVGGLLRLPAGSNPHRWYNPSDVQKVVSAIVSDYSRLDPADAAYFQDQRVIFDSVALHEYDSLVSEIRARYVGTPVGASESISSMLAPALGLNLITPYPFLRAISEGTDVSPADKVTVDSQIKHHLIKIYVYNSQNTTPDVQAQLQECRAEGIPTAVITETLVPVTATYQSWQAGQLEGILAALQKASAQ